MVKMCKELRLKGGFVAEFFELESPIRQDRDQGGGVHGNAIFSKFDMEFRVVDHKHHPFDWEKDGDALREPRVGRRYSLAAHVKHDGLPPMLCYCVHLEVFCGIIGRVSAFSDILKDSRENWTTIPHQMIFGDLNTMAHSIARLSPKYARDRYRFLSLGKQESQWWNDNVFGWQDTDGPLNLKLYFYGYNWLYRFYKWYCQLVYGKIINPIWPCFSGFPQEVLREARNPGFTDCWPSNMTTLTNYSGLFKARLDWTLTSSNFDVIEKEIGNSDYAASDHAYLMVHIRPRQTG
ncbi:hypothetical protein BC943DRAFT_214300 [Umbelopsis sp. AD052]|nr:hypothetical protein BC943DRAFT_214300 [Umbelopsis sp. AD052]